MISNGGKNKKELNFELNLMPVFDVLSVCICFLLMTVVWIQIGSMKTSQALGGQAASETKTPPSVWLTVDDKANVTFSFKNVSNKLGSQTLRSNNGQIRWDQVEREIQFIGHSQYGFQTAILMPAKRTTYEDVIHFMDLFRGNGLQDVGVSPL